MYPPWKSTFDAHVYEGRVLEVVLMQSTEEPLAKATMGMSVLAERCKKSKTNSCAEFWVDLHPSGRIQMVVQYYLEDGDTGKTGEVLRPQAFFPSKTRHAPLNNCTSVLKKILHVILSDFLEGPS